MALSLAEVGTGQIEALCQRGGFPLSFLADSDEASAAWREALIRLTVERDLPALGLGAPPAAVRRFWAMAAHYHGQIWNSAGPARSLGVGESTVRRYLDFLTDSFLIRQLPPWRRSDESPGPARFATCSSTATTSSTIGSSGAPSKRKCRCCWPRWRPCYVRARWVSGQPELWADPEPGGIICQPTSGPRPCPPETSCSPIAKPIS